jgi:hypothetical protein
MEQAQELLEAFKGAPDELLSSVTVAKGLRTNADWPRMAAASGRGPKATKCGRLTMFRRGDVVAWLHELARAHKAMKRRAG